MQKIPIPNNIKTISDPSYRYQRDEIIIRQNKQYFVLDNLNNIAKQLMIEEKEIIDFIQKYPKLNIKMIDNKVGINVGFNVISEQDIKNMIEKFIINYIICQECSYPELDVLDKNSSTYNICKSCGYNKNEMKCKTESEKKEISETEPVKKMSKKEMSKKERLAKKEAINLARLNKKGNKDPPY
jgi:translation initiation factor 2 beta subunit (eIF-2beta)/eIF-5